MTPKEKGAHLLMAHSDSALVSAFVAGYDRAKSSSGWINEDQLPDDYPYDDLYPYSKVDVVRMFPPLEFTQVLQEHAKLTKALRNCCAYANRPQWKKSPGAETLALNILRFCKSAGIEPSLLR